MKLLCERHAVSLICVMSINKNDRRHDKNFESLWELKTIGDLQTNRQKEV